MEERRLNWTQIIITAVVTGIVAFIVGMLLFQFQTQEPRLTYSAEDTLPFEGPLENIAIYHVKIENNGNKIVEDVICQLSFSTATITQSRIILEPSITYSDTISSNSYRVEIANLNPQESAILSILASSPEQLPNRPEISLRGKGITGVEAPRQERNDNSWWMIIVTAMVAAFTGLFMVDIFRKSSPKHSEDQRQILSYLCGIHKLNSEVERYLNMSSEASYWSESDRFAMLVIEDPTGEEAEKRKQVLRDLLEYARINPSSKGIIHYNIARIAKAQNNKEEADRHLEEAKKIIPKLVKTRVGLDPIWREN